MKKIYCTTMLLLFFAVSVFCQKVIVFRGTVRCFIQDDQRATKGAKNIVVVPGFIPAKAGMSNPQGYYELNTAIQMQKLDGKYVQLYYVSTCRECEIKKSVFVSEDQLRQSNNNLYLTVETIMMNAGCSLAEPHPLTSDSIYNSFIKLPGQDLEKASALNVLTATPGFLNTLTNVLATVAVGGGDGRADTLQILPGRIKYGNFLFASPMNLSGNTGFNFSPNRNFLEAVLWNPSALANTHHTTGVHVFTNLKNNHKFSAYTKITERVSLGIGGLYTKQDEFRPTLFSNLVDTVTHVRVLKEYAAYLTPVFKINNSFSVGVAIKSIWQSFNRPDSVLVLQQNPPINSFIDRTSKEQYIDADVSASYAITRSLTAGINIMNIAGTELFTDALPAQKKIVPVQKLRSLGIGLCYKYKQFNFGTDVLLTEDDLYDVSVGINYIPFNNALLAGGFAFRQKSFSFAFRMKYFRLSYVNDNNLLITDKRKGKNSLFNGQLHSGLSFTF